MTPTEQQNAALAAFVACVVADLNPSLNAHTKPRNGDAEYDVIIGAGSGSGVLHEQIEAVLNIAADHGGRAFIDCSDLDDPPYLRTPDRPGRGRLCIVWPGRKPDGPDPEHEHDTQARQGRRKSRQTMGAS